MKNQIRTPKQIKMSTRLFKNESKFLEQSRTALTNAKSEPAIKAALNEYTMTDEKLAAGEALYNKAYSIWQANTRENAETREAATDYKQQYAELQALFSMHRDKVKILFERDPDVLIKLGVKGRFPVKYNEFFDKVRLFYSTLKIDTDLMAKLVILKITDADVDNALNLLDELLAKRSEYDREMAESQVSTQTKNEALLNLKEWMDEFYTIAKIAFYDQPQKLEALGGFVRN